FDGWLHDLLGGPIPAETNATCDSCAMIVAGDTSGAPLADAGYNAETKCCTYLPELWNFLVGRVLLDDSPEAARGRATVEARLDSGVAVSPLGLRRDTAYRVLYATGGESIFGHAKAMRCPHYLHEEGGLCGVWRHRESTCATWFCKYVRGSVGRTFWMHLHQLLRFAEQSLAGWALLELGLEPRALARLYE